MKAADSPDANLSPYLNAAAVLTTFAPGELRPVGGGDPDLSDVSALLMRYAEPIRLGPAKGRWRLRDEVRRETLAHLGSREDLRQALAANEGPAGDPTQAAMVDLITSDEPPQLEGRGLDGLIGLERAIDWLEPVLGITLPPRDILLSRIERHRLVEPIFRLVENGFEGRQKELSTLRGYVGELPSLSVGETLSRWGGRLRDAFIQRPPMLIYGPGGVGKSTIIAKFILDHAEPNNPRPLPFIHLDFDRSTLDPERTDTLVLEAVRQLRVQFPEISQGATGLEATTSERLVSEDVGQIANSSHFIRSTEVRDELGELVAELARRQSRNILLVIDTFEIVQRRGSTAVYNVLMLAAQLVRRTNRLRIVVSGRGSPRREDFDFTEAAPTWRLLPLEGFDVESGRAYLEQRLRKLGNTTTSASTAARVVSLVRGNPLSLRLAAQVMAREGLAAVEDAVGVQILNAELAQEQIQGMLHARIVEHLEDDRLKAIADPGLAVRRITPAVIEQVLAIPCGLRLDQPNEANELFQLMAREVSLVEPAADGSLRHRADVRLVMLPLLRQRLHDKVKDIDRLAVKFWSGVSGDIAGAEEIYHRIWLNDTVETLESRWRPESSNYLGDVLDELNELDGDPAVRIWLSEKLRRDLPQSLRERADQAAWERDAEQRARRLLTDGGAKQALTVLSERPRRLPESPVRLLEIETLQLLGADVDALKCVEEGLQSAREAISPSYVFSLLMAKARLLERRGDFASASSAASEASRLAQAMRDDGRQFESDLTLLRLLRKLGQLGGQSYADLHAELAKALNSNSVRSKSLRPATLREAAAELGATQPSLLADALERVGLEPGAADTATVPRLVELLAGQAPALAALVKESGARTLAARQLSLLLRNNSVDPDALQAIADVFVRAVDHFIGQKLV